MVGQTISTGADTLSVIKHRKVTAECDDLHAMNRVKLPGRSCSGNLECSSGECSKNVCTGLEEADYCHSHKDCKPDMYC